MRHEDISEAWGVVNRLINDNHLFSLSTLQSENGIQWVARFECIDQPGSVHAMDHSAAQAIYKGLEKLAALK